MLTLMLTRHFWKKKNKSHKVTIDVNSKNLIWKHHQELHISWNYQGCWGQFWSVLIFNFLDRLNLPGCLLKLHWTLKTFIESLKNASCVSRLLDRILKSPVLANTFLSPRVGRVIYMPADNIWSEVERARILDTFRCFDPAWYEKRKCSILEKIGYGICCCTFYVQVIA